MDTIFRRAAFFLIVSWPSLFAAELDPIKASNQVGADISLMDNHDPMAEQENFDLLEGFEVNLFAMEPMIENPVHMVWGPRGRLWVACSWAYPQLKPGETPNDKIIILEDVDGDGTADKSTVFADGLYIPTGLELSNGGVYVAQTPDVLFLKDTDGDDIADFKEAALTGFGIEDSHHSISAWRRGPGGWIYFQEGRFLHTQVETSRGMVRNYDGGVYQYKPQTQELRVFANIGVGNPWGHVFDNWGQSFLIDNPRVNYLTPSTGNGGIKLPVMNLISTEKQCGGDLVTGSHFPDALQGMLLTCRFKSRTIIRYEFVEDRAGYGASVLDPLISSRHPNFRPVDCKIGPDGAAYVADWYNPIINHAGHDFRDPRRDVEHGRIWRITAKDRPWSKTPDLTVMSVSQLVEQLAHKDEWVRHQVKGLLSERNPGEVAQALGSWVQALDSTDPDFDHHLVEALWAYQNIEYINEAHLIRVLSAKTGQARAAAARLIRYWYPQLSNPLTLIEQTAQDPFPRVRLESILAAGYIPDANALPAALLALDQPVDKFIEYALKQTTAALIAFAQEGLEDGSLIFSNKEQRAYAMQSAGLGLEERIRDYIASWSGSEAEASAIWNELRRKASKKQIRLVARAMKQDSDSIPANHIAGILNALSKIGRREQIGLDPVIKPLVLFLDNSNDLVVEAATELVGAWRIYSAAPALWGIVEDAGRSLALRKAAVAAIGRLGQDELRRSLLSMTGFGNSVLKRYLGTYGLIFMDLEQAAEVLASLLELDPQDENPSFLIFELLSRQGGEAVLLTALDQVSIHPVVAEKVTAYFNQFGVLSQKVAEVFRPQDARPLNDQLMSESLDDLTADVEQNGDAERGEFIYRRTEMACMSCHAIGAVGPKIGPDLVAVGAASSTEYVVDSILRPNNAIAEHYETFSILTRDGKVYVGALVFQNEKEMVVRDTATGGEITISKNTIRHRNAMPSLMPAGLVAQLKSRQEFLDMSKFVASLGRPGPFSSSSAQVIRKWQVLPDTRSAIDLDLQKVPDSAFWMPAYGTVRGELLVSDYSSQPSLFAIGYLNVLQAGAVSLSINASDGLRLWVDDREVSDLSAPLNLGQGRRQFTFLIDNQQRGGKGLRVEFVNAGDNSARFQVETGM